MNDSQEQIVAEMRKWAAAFENGVILKWADRLAALPTAPLVRAGASGPTETPSVEVTDKLVNASYVIAFSGEGAAVYFATTWVGMLDTFQLQVLGEHKDCEEWRSWVEALSDMDNWTNDEDGTPFQFNEDVGEITHVSIYRHDTPAASPPTPESCSTQGPLYPSTAQGVVTDAMWRIVTDHLPVHWNDSMRQNVYNALQAALSAQPKDDCPWCGVSDSGVCKNPDCPSRLRDAALSAKQGAAPAFNQAEFDELTRKGAVAWAGVDPGTLRDGQGAVEARHWREAIAEWRIGNGDPNDHRVQVVNWIEQRAAELAAKEGGG